MRMYIYKSVTLSICDTYPYPMGRVKHCDKLANAYETGTDRMDVNEDSAEPARSLSFITAYTISAFKVRKHMYERHNND